MHDVVVVGAGAAGVATAYYLRDSGLDVVVLDENDHVGGRARAVRVGGLTVNVGAMFVYRDTRAEQLASELGIETEPFEPSTYGIHIDGQTVVDTDNDRLVRRLPLDDDAREQLTRFLDESMVEYRRYTRGGAMVPEAAELAGRSVQDKLDGWHPDVQRIVQTAVQGGAVGKASQTSATYGLRYFASYLAHEKHNRLFPPNGMQQLVQRMADRLPVGSVRLGTTVTEIGGGPDGLVVQIVGADGERETASARLVVLAVPAPRVEEVLPDLPEWKRAALAQAATPGSRTLGVVADVTDAPHLAEWAFVTTVGRAFDAIINPAPGRPRRDPPSAGCSPSTCATATAQATRRGSARSRTAPTPGSRTSSRSPPICAVGSAACTGRRGRTASRCWPRNGWRCSRSSAARSAASSSRATTPPRPRGRTVATTRRTGSPSAYGSAWASRADRSRPHPRRG